MLDKSKYESLAALAKIALFCKFRNVGWLVRFANVRNVCWLPSVLESWY